MADHNVLGKLGEDYAVKYILKKGYKLLARNWSFQKKELDIIAIEKKILVIIEVKSRSSEYFEHPADAVTLKKMKNITQATQAYVDYYDIGLEVRFDIISVIKSGSSFKLEHIEDAFLAPLS